jgi:hypothetical protein
MLGLRGVCGLIGPQNMRWSKWATCVLPFVPFSFIFYFQKFIVLHKSTKLMQSPRLMPYRLKSKKGGLSP